MADTKDTIVAAATAPGSGGVGIVRLSGSLATDIAETIVGPLPEPRVATLTSFCGAGGEKLDSGLVLYFPAPNSFTGEDVVEFHGHGGAVVLSAIVGAAVALGARRAAPGEFSKRAFLNGKLDLVQAEAIADLIASGSAQAARAALRSLSGEFSTAVNALVAELTKLRVHVEAAIDFPEEEIDFLCDRALLDRIEECRLSFEHLLARANVGRVLRDGYQVVLVGKPNAGKSSLMNRLSGEQTAIVTEIAGTTRDILRETIEIDGLSVELVDTAGLRENPDIIEREGIRRAREAMANADAVVWIHDASDAGDVANLVNASGARVPAPLAEQLPEDIPVLLVVNKTDLREPAGLPAAAVPISAKTGDGLDDLRARIVELAGYRNLGEGAFTARRRHVDALKLAGAHFKTGQKALAETRAGELLAEELRLAQQALGTITGEVTSDDLLGRIFSDFCIGK